MADDDADRARAASTARARAHRVRERDRLRAADHAVRRRDAFAVSVGVLVAVVVEAVRVGDALARGLRQVVKDEALARQDYGFSGSQVRPGVVETSPLVARAADLVDADTPLDAAACDVVRMFLGDAHAERLRSFLDSRPNPFGPGPTAGRARRRVRADSARAAAAARTRAMTSKERADADRARKAARLRAGAEAQRDLDRWSLSLAALGATLIADLTLPQLRRLAARERKLRGSLRLRDPGLLKALQPARTDNNLVPFIREALGPETAAHFEVFLQATAWPRSPPSLPRKSPASKLPVHELT